MFLVMGRFWGVLGVAVSWMVVIFRWDPQGLASFSFPISSTMQYCRPCFESSEKGRASLSLSTRHLAGTSLIYIPQHLFVIFSYALYLRGICRIFFSIIVITQNYKPTHLDTIEKFQTSCPNQLKFFREKKKTTNHFTSTSK